MNDNSPFEFEPDHDAGDSAWLSCLEGEAQPVQLSRSRIWEVQQQFYKRAGVAAWDPSAVPFYATSNSAIAYSYASVIGAFFADYLSSSEGNPDQPLYIVEAGTGMGRFSYHILQHLFSNMHLPAAMKSRLVYVMSDISSANIGYWRNHPQFQQFIRDGRLDFASFDICKDGEINLLESGRCVSHAGHDAAIVYIANYVFDSIPHDFFALHNGQMHERLVGYGFSGTPTHSQDIVRMTDFFYQEEECECDGYYADEDRNSVLKAYAGKFDDLNFSLPTGGFDAVDNMRKISAGPHLMLTADFGDSTESELAHLPPRRLATNGIHSVKVNYDSVGKYVRLKGGRYFINERVSNALVISGILSDRMAPAEFGAMAEAFEQYICDFGPDDFFTIKKIVETEYDRLSVKQVIALLQLSKWDYRFFTGCEDALSHQIPDLSQPEKDTLATVLEKTLKMHFVDNKDRDISPAIFRLLEDMGFDEKAAQLRQGHQRLFG